jgi:FAD/FMN-containing dehydrogenase
MTLRKWLWHSAIGALINTGSAEVSHRDVDTYCERLALDVPGRVWYADSPAYNESITSYYSGQERDFRPGCIFSPTSAEEVSTFVKIVTSTIESCAEKPKFAVRSGGHMIWAGSANINDGITLDLRALNSVVVNDDKTVASLGVGGIWNEIYPQLVPYNLTVMGGRVSGIGVGGLATGGEIYSAWVKL